LIDFHGEASSEKQAFAHYLDGQVGAVLGTHSHVQTADERILPKGTAAITDVGMSGCFDSVIGAKKEIVIQKFLSKMPARFEPAEGPGGYGAVVVEFDEKTGLATEILRYREEVIPWTL
jgi:calcineurin-like phosphoesterase